MPHRPNITICSAAMFSTWVFFPADHLTFDLGDGLTSRLRHKLIKINQVFLSHGHRDHVGGLFMFLNVRTNNEGTVEVFYPRDTRIVREMERFMPHFERNVRDRARWTPVGPGQEIPLVKKNLFARTFVNDHYNIDDDRIRGLGYHLVEKKKKVRAELRHLSQQEIFSLIKEKGRHSVLEDVEEIYLTYSGDTAPLSPAVVHGTRALLHEATFLNEEDRAADSGEARYHKHSTLNEAMRTAVEGEVGHLGLFHFSTRYSGAEVMEAVRSSIDRFRPSFPVSVALPGAFTEDVLQYNLNKAAGLMEGDAAELEKSGAVESD